MICDLILSAGIECQQVTTPKGEMTHLTLPFQLSDGSGLGVYVVKQGLEYLVSDDGATIFHLSCNDIDLSDRRKWTTLRNTAVRYGYQISEEGTIHRTYSKAELVNVAQDVLLLMAEIISWEATLFETGDLDLSLNMMVEELLTEVYQAVPERNKEVKGLHGALYVFDFYIDKTYIDVFKPHAITTGSKLRKVHDLRRLDDDLDIMFVIDDRFDEEKATSEMGIFTSTAVCTRLTDLIKRADNSLADRH